MTTTKLWIELPSGEELQLTITGTITPGEDGRGEIDELYATTPDGEDYEMDKATLEQAEMALWDKVKEDHDSYLEDKAEAMAEARRDAWQNYYP